MSQNTQSIIKNIDLQLIDLLFPYNYKNQQKDLIINLITNNKVLLYSQTGYGKSISSLIANVCTLLNPANNINKIIVLVRMKTQIFRILEECFVINKKYKNNKSQIDSLTINKNSLNNILSLPLIAKEDLCIHSSHPTGIIDCKALNCSYYTVHLPNKEILKNLFDLNLEPIKNTNDIISFVGTQTPNNCPYYVIRALLSNAQIIVTTQSWLIKSKLRKELFKNVNLDRTALIIDEVHNFRPQTTHSIDYMNILEATKLCDKYNLICKNFLHEVEYNFRNSEIDETDFQIKNKDTISIFLQDSISNLKLKSLTNHEHNSLITLQSFYDMITSDQDGELWHYDREDNKKLLKRVIIFPETIFNLLSPISKVILMSGTIYPPEAYKYFFGLTNDYKIIKTPQYQNNILYAIYTNINFSSRFKNRNIGLFVKQNIIIEKLHNINPFHTLVFSTSHEFTQILVKCYEKLYQKTVFNEGTSIENQNILSELTTKDHELIYATFGGSFSEGIEIKDNITNYSKITLIIFCGIPVPPPTVQQKLIKIKYLQRHSTQITSLFLKWLPIYQTL